MDATDRTNRRHLAGVVLGLTALLTLVVTAFAWPASEIAPRDLPVTVVGPPGAQAAVEAGSAAAAGEGAFDVVPAASRTEAVEMLEERESMAALVLSPAGTELLTASAAGPAVAQLMEQVASRLAAGQPDGATLVVTDVVPLPADDPRGLVFNAGSLPLVLGGLLTGVAVAVRVRRRGATAVLAVLGVAAAAGLAAAGVLQGWLGALDGSYWSNAGVVALGLAATALGLVGLHRVLGLPGLAAGALTVLLLGNPLSGVTSAPELLPDGWSTLGQLLPPGATGSALRSTAFFDGAGSGLPLLVLSTWVLAGAALALLPPRGTSTVEPTARREAERQPA